MSTIPDRFAWATEVIGPEPTDAILEIGCGAGLLAEQLAAPLTIGKITAIDRSSAMIGKAVKRNQVFIDRGVADFIVANIADSGLPHLYFDKIVAFNVNFFRKNPSSETEMVKHLLKPCGKLYIFYQHPFEIDVSAAEPVKNILLEAGFKIEDILFKKLLPTSAYAIIAKP